MKRLALITTAFLVISAATSGIAAKAATIYPDEGEFTKKLTFTSLTDYAVDGEAYAFSEHTEGGDSVKVFKKGTLTEYPVEGDVDGIDYFDGVLYYQSGETVYSLPDNAESEYTLNKFDDEIKCGGFLYYYDDQGALTVYDMQNKTADTLSSGFSNLKVYDKTVYAVRGNNLYKFDGAIHELIEFTYSDYGATNTIEIGQAVTNLTQDYALKFVTVAEGSFMTEIDLTDVGGPYFRTKETTHATEDTLALLLCYTGNAAVVAVGEKSYITLKTSVTETSVNCYKEPDFTKATVIGNRIYASPFVVSGTTALFPATGEVVTILHKVEHPSLGNSFYEVEYDVTDENGEVTGTKTGYVTDGFLRKEIIEDNKDPVEIPDANYSEKNDVRKVILILMVVILVLAAAGYLTYAGTAGKFKKDKHKENDIKE